MSSWNPLEWFNVPSRKSVIIECTHDTELERYQCGTCEGDGWKEFRITKDENKVSSGDITSVGGSKG